ncbi:hypothetical protein SAMN05421761_10540 [Belliella pelovolcani]|uniref:Uncharacterized protein n=1 Tax=Belliella pelovolcani TaxID=529505 RepID=A0A1N7M335_9BACT|nr:hypothetical protein SAMN05421761_10540 [Belliella pelovolcani]
MTVIYIFKLFKVIFHLFVLDIFSLKKVKSL